MKQLESAIENAVVRWARKHGLLNRKMNGFGFNAWPDRMFMLPGAPLFIEFKREGEEPTPAQTDIHGMLRRLGYEVQVHDHQVTAIAAIKKHMEAHQAASPRRKALDKSKRGRAVSRSRRR